MISFIDLVAPLSHDRVIHNGWSVIVRSDGSTKTTYWPIDLLGKKSHIIQVRTIDSKHIRITGNPAGFIQGQYTYGMDDVLATCLEVLHLAAKKLDITPTVENHMQWRDGFFTVNAIEVGYNFKVKPSIHFDHFMNHVMAIYSSVEDVGKADRFSNSSGIKTLTKRKRSNSCLVKIYNMFEHLVADKKNNNSMIGEKSTKKTIINSSSQLLRISTRFSKSYLIAHNLTTGTDLSLSSLKYHFLENIKECRIVIDEKVGIGSIKDQSTKSKDIFHYLEESVTAISPPNLINAKWYFDSSTHCKIRKKHTEQVIDWFKENDQKRSEAISGPAYWDRCPSEIDRYVLMQYIHDNIPNIDIAYVNLVDVILELFI